MDDTGAPPPPPGRMARQRSSQRLVSILAAETITSITVPDAERKLGVDGGLHSYYAIRVATTRRTLAVEKRYSEMWAVHCQLADMFPARFLATAPPGDDGGGEYPLVDVDLRAAPLMLKRRTARTMEARRVALETYLRQAVADPSVGTLVLSVLSGPQGVPAAVVEVEEGDDDDEEGAPSGPGRPASDSIGGGGADGDDGDGGFTPEPATITFVARAPRDAAATAADVAAAPPAGPFAPASRVPFSLDDMDAFDALLENGFCVVPLEVPQSGGDDGSGPADVPRLPDAVRGQLPTGDAASTAAPLPGQRVWLSFASLVWDGGSSSALRFDAAAVASFTLGDCRDAAAVVPTDASAAPHGLHDALRSVAPGASATVVLAPKLAFGKTGVLPLLPAGAHVVVHLTLHAVAAGPQRPMTRFSYEHLVGGGGSGADPLLARRRSYGTGGRVRIAADEHPVRDDELAAWEAGTGVSVAGGGGAQQPAAARRAPRVTLVEADPPAWAAPSAAAAAGPYSRAALAATAAVATLPADSSGSGGGAPSLPSVQAHSFNSWTNGTEEAAAAAAAAVATGPAEGSRAARVAAAAPSGFFPPSGGGGGGGIQRAADGSLITASGVRLPSPEEAERAFRLYLASIGAAPLPVGGAAAAPAYPAPPAAHHPATAGGPIASPSKGGGAGGNNKRFLMRHFSWVAPKDEQQPHVGGGGLVGGGADGTVYDGASGGGLYEDDRGSAASWNPGKGKKGLARFLPKMRKGLFSSE